MDEEKQSSLTTETTNSDDGKTIVDWKGDADPSHPHNWSKSRKWFIIGLTSLTCFNGAIVSTIFAPGVPDVLEEFHISSGSLESFMVTVYLIGSVIGPLLLPPISECYGRLLITHVSNVGFLFSSILCAAAVNMPMIIVARFLMGIAASVPSTVGGGIIADLMVVEERGTALTAWTIGNSLSQVLGPIFGGYIVYGAGWRWTVWVVVIIGGLVMILAFLFQKESHAPTLLRHEAARLQKLTGVMHRARTDDGQPASVMIKRAITRPLRMMVQAPIVTIASCYNSVSYTYMYICITSFTRVFERTYGFDASNAGLAYVGLGVGSCLAQLTIASLSDRYIQLRKSLSKNVKPEHRLFTLVAGVIVLPIGLFWYGWTAHYKVHWIAPIIGTSFVGFGIMCVQLSVQLYLVDGFSYYAASAVAANLAIKSTFGTVIPLAGAPLYDSLGLGWGNSLLGFIAVGLIPASLVLMKYGDGIRVRGKFCGDSGDDT